MEVPRLQIRAVAASYTIDIATRDLSRVCDLHHSSRQCWILNPLSKARDRTRYLMVASPIRIHCAMMQTPLFCFFEDEQNKEMLEIELTFFSWSSYF